VTQGVGPELKSQYCKNKTKQNKHTKSPDVDIGARQELGNLIAKKNSLNTDF
jgi:hypothetical protein